MAPTSSKSPAEAGQQITRDKYEWGGALGVAFGPISYGFRANTPPYNDQSGFFGLFDGGYDNQNTFSQFNRFQIDAADAAIGLWDDLANVSFTRVGTGNLGASAYTDSATILFANYYNPDDKSGAYAHKPGNTAFSSRDGDVWNNIYDDDVDSSSASLHFLPGSYNFMSVVHEVGHALGLEHPGNYNAGPGVTLTYANDATYVEDTHQHTVMSYFGAWIKQNGNWSFTTESNPANVQQVLHPSTPMVDDIAAIQRLYGADTNTRVGDTTYGFNSNADRSVFHVDSSSQLAIFSVWDAGGNDTFDWSGYSTSEVIDLRPGQYSSVGGLPQNIGVAAAVTVNGRIINYIENAYGGSGTDYIIGNAADNILKGNGGNDTLEGNWGNDTIYGGGDTDTAVFYGPRTSYIVSRNADGSIRVSSAGSGATDGTDTLYDVELYKFTDRATAYTLTELLPDASPPLLSNSSPTDNANGVSTSANIVLTFNESVLAGSGSFEVHKSDGTLVRTIASTDISQVTFSGNTVTINPSTDLLGGTGYYLLVSPTAIRDRADNFYTGIVSPTSLNFTTSTATDTAAPVLSSVSPADNSGAVPVGSNLQLTFNEVVLPGSSGTIDIHNSDGSIFRSISVLDASQVTFNNNVVTINPGVDLAAGSDYYISVTSGAIKDIIGNPFAGISSSTSFNFTTASAPYVPPPHDSSIFLSIFDNTVTEGSNGSKILSFGVTLSGAGAGTETVSVQYATQDIAGASSPALAGQDYIVASGVLVIPAGETSGHIDVLVFGDLQFEPDEVFRLVLTQPSSNLTLLDSSGHVASSIFATGFIDNDDQATNHAPVGMYDLTIAAPNTPITIDVLANDTDPDGNTLHIGSGSGLDPFARSAGGTVALVNNKILFTPDNNFSGVFSYSYVLDDGHNGSVNVFSQVIVGGDGTPGVTDPGTVGDDLISGTGGNDVLSGGFGSDIIAGGPGADRIDGGPGFDYLDLRQAAHGAHIQFRDAWTWDDGDGDHDILTNIEGVLGSPYNDTIDGHSNNIQYISTGYRFYGGNGNDNLQSEAGDDILDGGDGDDNLLFGSGRDIVFGGAGNDHIYSFNGYNDTLGDTLDGGSGDDFIYANDGHSADTLTGGDGNDYLQFSDGDIATGGPGADKFFIAGFNAAAPYHATITDLQPGDTIQWYFPNAVVINNYGYYFIGPITYGDGSTTALDHVEFASANGQTTLYFGYDATPGADSVLTINGTFSLNQFQVDDSGSTLSINVLAANHAPVLTVASANVAATAGQTFAASSLFSASDLDGDTLRYYLYDGSPAADSGHFVVNGTVVPANTVYTVTAAQLAQTSFVAGAAGTSDNLYAMATDGQLKSNNNVFSPFHVNVTNETSSQPDLTVSNLIIAQAAARPGQTITIDYDLNNIGPVGATGFELGFYISTDPTVDRNDQLFAYQPNASQLANSSTHHHGTAPLPNDLTPGVTYYIGVIADDTDVIPNELRENNNVSNVVSITATANIAPVLTVASANVAATAGQTIAASSLFSATDANGDTLSYYLYDGSPAANSGHWVVNGAVVPANTVYTVTAAQLAQTSFVAGAAGTSDNLYAMATDGQLKSNNNVFTPFHVNVANVNHAPVLTVASANVAATAGQTIAASSLFSASDLDGDTLRYYLYDGSPAADSGHWVVNGTVVPANTVYTVTAAQLAQTSFVAGDAGTSDNLYAMATDGQLNSNNNVFSPFHILV